MFVDDLELPEDMVSIPPVIVSPFSVETLNSDPYHITQRNLRQIHLVSQAGQDIRVAVIDTGIDPNHEDIKHALVRIEDATSSRGNGVDSHGHGTHVASTIVGKRCGGAPKAKLYSIKSLDDSGIGQDTWIARAIDMAIAWKAHVINMSLGSSHPSPRILAALQRAYNEGIIVVAATGNESASSNSYPANFNEVCLAVAAVDKAHRRAVFSNAGQGTDICDYGVAIVAAKAGGGFVRMDGTSMATPNAAAMIANRLSYEQHYNIRPVALKQRHTELPQFCIDLGTAGRDRATGFGIIDAFKAFGQPPTPTQPTPPPTPTPPTTSPGNPGQLPQEPVSPPNQPTDDRCLGSLYRAANGSLYFVNAKGKLLPLD